MQTFLVIIGGVIALAVVVLIIIANNCFDDEDQDMYFYESQPLTNNMRKQPNTSLSKQELASLDAITHRDLKLLSFFYYECIIPNKTGIIKRVTAIQMLETLEDFYTKTGEAVPEPNLTPAHD